MVLKVLEKIGRSLEKGAEFGSAYVSTSPRAALSTIAELKKFDHTGGGFYHEYFV